MNKLKEYGFTDRVYTQAEEFKKENDDLHLARIIGQYRDRYKIISEFGEMHGNISGKFRFSTEHLSQYPAVGDFVLITFTKNDDIAIIHNILPRKSIFGRTAVGSSQEEQVLATNIDIIFICMSLNNNYSLNRLERYLSIAWDSGAKPVVVLTKSDLCKDIDGIITEVEEVSFYSEIIVTTNQENNSEKFAHLMTYSPTVVFVGSSGVGKSTLINQLVNEKLATSEIGQGDKGRHTTTGREMFQSKYGGVIIDTPGTREVGIQNTDVTKSFNDIEELAQNCKFRDCTHMKEPGCAVKKALENGTIDQRRLDNYSKLLIESSYDGLNSRQIEEAKLNRMFKSMGGHKSAKKQMKNNLERKNAHKYELLR